MERPLTMRAERYRNRGRFAAVFALLALAVLFLGVLSLCTGTVEIAVPDVLRAIALRTGGDAATDIILRIRFPRALMAALLGGALSLSGFLLQTYFDNPIAGPFVLGISSGAKLAVVAVMILALRYMRGVSSLSLITAAFLGALMVTALILLFAGRARSIATLLIVGIMVGYICSAISEFLIAFAEDADIVNLHGWSQGSFSGMNWDGVRAASIIVLPAFLVCMALSKPIGAMQMGEAHARSVGVRMQRLRLAVILLSGLLSACVTAFAGPVSFIGIAVPILTRRIFRTSRPLIVIPGCFLGGAAFCMGCDLIARTVLAPTELSISSVTAVFGAPVVIAAMLQKRRRK